MSQTTLLRILGTYGFSKLDVFWKTSVYIADFFGFKTVYFGRKFWTECPKRGEVISNPKNFIANLRKLVHI